MTGVFFSLKMKHVGNIFMLLFILTFITFVQCEFVTFGVAGIISGLAYYTHEKYKCMYQECCTNEYIFPDIDSKLLTYILLLFRSMY